MSTIVWAGLDELKAQLRALPAALAGEASGIVTSAATSAAEQIRSAYPARTGTLKDHVFVSTADPGPYGAGAVVKNTAKHAWIFENGTQARHTALGANRGSMPPGHVFLPIVIRQRRAMYVQLKALLERHGALVSGEAA